MLQGKGKGRQGGKESKQKTEWQDIWTDKLEVKKTHGKKEGLANRSKEGQEKKTQSDNVFIMGSSVFRNDPTSPHL